MSFYPKKLTYFRKENTLMKHLFETYIRNFARHTNFNDILTMDYFACWDLIKKKHEQAEFNEFYDVYMQMCMNI